MKHKKFPSAFFITGTDTGIGKTVVSALLTKGLEATYWKPVQSGLKEETDTETVRRLTELSENYFREETYRLSEPLSPHASAAIDNLKINMNTFKLPDYSTDHLVVEGAGGVLVPLNDESMMIDLITLLHIPTIVVARSELGTLNHTFLTLEALRKRGIPILGVIMNGPENKSNKQAIEKYGRVEVLVEVEPLKEVNAQSLTTFFKKYFTY